MSPFPQNFQIDRCYAASSLPALVSIFRQHEVWEEKDVSAEELEKLKAFFEIPYLMTSISRDAHAAFSYTTCDDGAEHRGLSIKEYLEFDFGNDELNDEEKAQLEPVFASDHLWEYQIYARTPVGFYKGVEPTLLALLSNLPESPC